MFEYDLVKVPSGEIYVLAKELVEAVMQAAKIDSWEVLGTLMGSDLEMMRTKHPIMDRESIVICGDHVTLDAGTGCVHNGAGLWCGRLCRLPEVRHPDHRAGGRQGHDHCGRGQVRKHVLRKDHAHHSG